MNCLYIRIIIITWLTSCSVQASPPNQAPADSQAIREIQELDQSQLDFDFFEDNSNEPLSDNQQSSEAALLEALKLLDQSPDETYLEDDLLAPLEANNDLLDEDHQLSTDMDEEIEASLDQDINDEIEDVVEDFFDEE